MHFIEKTALILKALRGGEMSNTIKIQDILDAINFCNEEIEYNPEKELELRKIREDAVARDLKILKRLEGKNNGIR